MRMSDARLSHQTKEEGPLEGDQEVRLGRVSVGVHGRRQRPGAPGGGQRLARNGPRGATQRRTEDLELSAGDVRRACQPVLLRRRDPRLGLLPGLVRCRQTQRSAPAERRRPVARGGVAPRGRGCARPVQTPSANCRARRTSPSTPTAGSSSARRVRHSLHGVGRRCRTTAAGCAFRARVCCAWACTCRRRCGTPATRARRRAAEVSNPHGVRLQRGARIVQLVVFRLSAAARLGLRGPATSTRTAADERRHEQLARQRLVTLSAKQHRALIDRHRC